MRKVSAKLSFANVMSVVAVFIALGGASYAAVNIPNNSVGSADIKKNAVKASEIANNAVRTGEVKNHSLTCADLAPEACVAGLKNVTVRSHTEPLPLNTC